MSYSRLTILLLLANIPLLAHTPLDKVRFVVPAEWRIINENISDSNAVRLYAIRIDTIKGKAHYTNGLLRAFTVPDSIGIGHADGIVHNAAEEMQYLLSAQDGDYWKTYMLVGREDEEQYIMLFRIGIYHGTGLEFLVAFPHDRSIHVDKSELRMLILNPDYVLDERKAGLYCNPAQLEPYVSAFNMVCASLKIEDQGLFKAGALFIDPPTGAVWYRDTTLSR